MGSIQVKIDDKILPKARAVAAGMGRIFVLADPRVKNSKTYQCPSERYSAQSLCVIGKPEPLKGNLSSFCGRHIDERHRLVYRVVGENFQIAQCKGHYDDYLNMS